MPLDDAAAPAAAEPISLAGQDAPTAAEQPASLSLTSAVMFVSDLDRSVAFYACRSDCGSRSLRDMLSV